MTSLNILGIFSGYLGLTSSIYLVYYVSLTLLACGQHSFLVT